MVWIQFDSIRIYSTLMNDLRLQFLHHLKMMVFKTLNDLGPKYMYDMFTKNSHFIERNLRNTTTDLRLPLRKSTVVQKSFSYRVVRVWNSLSTECKETRSLVLFFL